MRPFQFISSYFESHPFWITPTTSTSHHDDDENRRAHLYRILDRHGFDWKILVVAGSGFLTDSYNIFATNVILPSLVFVYWTADSNSDNETGVNQATLVGSMVGQLVFGYLADRYGRRKLYGLELIVVIFGTLGMVQCSAGYSYGLDSAMSIRWWLIFWRFLVGLGIGAEYPLSAVITAEFAPRDKRSSMMAAVFSMQPLGQLLASAVGLIVLVTMGKNFGLDKPMDVEEKKVIVDRIWRLVIGVGAIPALFALAARLTIPESPRYTLDVDQDGARALRDAQIYRNTSSGPDTGRPSNEDRQPGVPLMTPANIYLDDAQLRNFDSSGHGPLQMLPRATRNDNSEEILTSRAVSEPEAHSIAPGYGPENVAQPREAIPAEDGAEPKPFKRNDQFSYVELKEFFWTQGNITYIMGTSMCWFILDVAYYGVGINNPGIIAQIWASSAPPDFMNSTIPNANPNNFNTITGVADWDDEYNPSYGIYQALYYDGIHSIITTSIGSLLGSLVLIKAINYLPRRSWLAWSFVGLAILFAICGGSYFSVAQSNYHAVTITLFVLSQLLFNLGPNALTFIIPAEIFPTRYRATCHGISAAAGKLGSVVIQAILSGLNNVHKGPTRDPTTLAILLVVFSPLMLLGAFIAWNWLPEIQNPRSSKSGSGLKDFEIQVKSLEELGKGRQGASTSIYRRQPTQMAVSVEV